MISSRFKRLFLLAAVALVLLPFSPVVAGEKLKVFILAGQSNMVGHARAHTIPTLLASDKTRDRELVRLVFHEGSGLSRETLEKQLALGKKLDELTGGISHDKIKALKDGPEKKALEAKVKDLKDAHEAYKQKIASACVVSRMRASSVSTAA